MEIVEWRNWDDKLSINYFREHPHENMLYYTVEEFKAVAAAARKAGYIFPGDYHQNGYHGVPIFDNGKPFQVTQRKWGHVMTLAWPELIKKIRENRKDTDLYPDLDYCYYSWYNIDLKDTYVFPEKR